MVTTTPAAALTVMQEMALKISNIVDNHKDGSPPVSSANGDPFETA